MKIIKKGTPPGAAVFHGTCQTCGCQVEVTKAETEYSSGDRPGEVGAYYVKCPTVGCGRDYLWVGPRITPACYDTNDGR